MVFEIVRHRSRVISAVLFVYGFLVLWSSSSAYGVVATICLFGWASLAGVLLAACMFVFAYLIVLRRSKEIYKVNPDQSTTWILHSATMETIWGELDTKIPYGLVKKSWQTKKYLYLVLKGSPVMGCPKASIGKKDRQMLAKELKIKIK